MPTSETVPLCSSSLSRTRGPQGRRTEYYDCKRFDGEARPRVIYFGTSRRQIVCPYVRIATEDSEVTSYTTVLHRRREIRLASVRRIKLHPLSFVRLLFFSPIPPPFPFPHLNACTCLHAAMICTRDPKRVGQRDEDDDDDDEACLLPGGE